MLYSESLKVEVREEDISSVLGLPCSLSPTELLEHGVYDLREETRIGFGGPVYEYLKKTDHYVKLPAKELPLEETKEICKEGLSQLLKERINSALEDRENLLSAVTSLILDEKTPMMEAILEKKIELSKDLHLVGNASSLGEITKIFEKWHN
jgi:hypothetical protein